MVTLQHGAKVLNPHGGEIHGFFFYPAIVSPVSSKMRLYYEEQFGPVIPIVPFEQDDEAIRYVVDSPFGQQLSFFGKGSKRIAHLIDACANRVSRINLNTQCQRGLFSIRTIVATKTTAENKALVHNILTHRESAFLSTDYIF